MTVNELIEKYNLRIGYRKGEKGILVESKRIGPKEAEMIRTLKPEILKELDRREEEKESARKAELEAKAAETKARIEDIKNNKIKIKLSYHDGEYLSGYSVYGEEAGVLKELDLASYVSGWGNYVKDEVVKALGEEFYYSDLLAYVKPMIEAKETKKLEKEGKEKKRVAEIFTKAKETGEKQVLSQTYGPCNDPDEECNLDSITTWAMPDGTTKVTRSHTW